MEARVLFVIPAKQIELVTDVELELVVIPPVVRRHLLIPLAEGRVVKEIVAAVLPMEGVIVVALRFLVDHLET